jgi:hypothetical protein
MRLVKCYGFCNEKHEKSEMLQISNKNYCKNCYNTVLKEKQDYEDLKNLLKQMYNINYPTGLQLRQIKDFKTNNLYTYKNIRLTIDYIVRVKKMQMDLKYGIALVPHFYEEMLQYYREMLERKEKMKDVEITERKLITIKPFKHENKYKQSKLISMEEYL